MSLKGDKMSPKGDKMSPKGDKTEFVRLEINGHMTSVGEDILCVLDKHTKSGDCRLRVFVLERLSVAAEWMCSLVQREMETLETLLEKQNKLLDIDADLDIDLHTADFLHLPVCKEEVPPEEERSSSLVQEEPQPPHIKEEQEELLQRPEEAGGSTLTLLAVKSEDDDENRETEPVAGTSTEHMKTQAYVEHWVRSQPTSDEQLLSSHCSESDTEDTRGDQSALNTLKSHKTQHVEGQRLSLSNKMSLDLKPSKGTHSMQSHAGKTSFSCAACCKTFNHKGNLNKHMMTHTGERPFTCSVCGIGVRNTGDLNTHMRTHTGEKPFTCTVCGKGFRDNGNLKTHMRTHTGERPFNCTVCNKCFRHNGNLKIHMRSHTGEKPLSCKVCSKAFGNLSNLKRHMRSHAEGGNI